LRASEPTRETDVGNRTSLMSTLEKVALTRST
jgi:hypothetical protein